MTGLYSLNFWLIVLFIVGYSGIILEHKFKISKTAFALSLAVLGWSIYSITTPEGLHEDAKVFGEYVSDVAGVFFFLLSAMAIVELIDSHKGFYWLTRMIKTHSKKGLFVILGFITFFLSAVLDNLTTTIVMVTLLKKLIPDSKERLLFACMVVIAANAGGAWTPIGDVTTTMLWIEEKISTWMTIKTLLLPSLVSLAVPVLMLLPQIKGKVTYTKSKADKPEPHSKLIFAAGILGLLFIPVFKTLTGLPPFMGALCSLTALWLLSDILHRQQEDRKHLHVPYVLSKLDLSNVLFFLGILMAIGVLEKAHILKDLADVMGRHIHSEGGLAAAIGILSAIIDNVPLVAASMGMYPDAGMDAGLWLQIAYAAGVGGSILVIGSASGVALMGLERVTFIDYLKKISLPALAGFISGLLILNLR